ncbi:hypothetical protein E4U22_003860 [Claviceps purpurea]|uniref:Uncharacterized protein n=2 Tax=Claviceps TaxID=5110 RepID=M1WHP6_CLAP2|nr:hypothetical protein E4U17_007138 [Claviceps sp. LM77 group G4]KAG6071239.1 hypothetical protein E4U33_003824 [Claviceps sp. LM78 group G4]KAG6080258.1 hypothetical protein E4U16_000472 [Claviceps sp. LM84 group G4]KAG6142087.1 hypothetical protein E4U12_003755 [Claviceps purpurea]KAG6290679.1 hypothetical protein E4U09_004304 [Claviceps aff. purpurea]CCE33094.1 uncharacterized protein CPUR_07017 [Claviceps purpurea 20.1]
MTVEVSHGRGGAGNIKEDETSYVDGEVVRAGIEGSHGDGAYSAGRGGAGNIGDIGRAPTPRKDHDIVPEAAYRASQDNKDYHIGRGGAGNEHVAQRKAHKADEKEEAPVGFADRLKQKLFGMLKR